MNKPTLGVMLVIFAASQVTAQSIARRVQQVKDGTVRMSFASRPDVCGNGRGSINVRNFRYGSRHRDEWVDECESGPVRVAMDVAEGKIVAVRSYVGGRWRTPGDAVDLGNVGVREATDFLLDNVARTDVQGRLTLSDASGSYGGRLGKLPITLFPFALAYEVAHDGQE